MNNIDWNYPMIFGADFDSTYKSLWLGWWLVTWCYTDGRIQELSIAFQPGL